MSACITSHRVPNAKGYDYVPVKVDGKWKKRGAHRVAWEEANGPIPDGMLVCHTCDNRRCLNVEHMFLGTNEDNLHDMAEKGRARNSGKTHCQWGHEYTESNTFRYRDGRRECRQCRTLRFATRSK